MKWLKSRKQERKPANDRPAHWTLGWSGSLELGFEDGTYLPRKAALLLYPQYFDEQGNPKLDMLPIEKR